MLAKITQVLLWISIIAWSLWFGGLIYETIVILPLWSDPLPQAVIEWNSRPLYMVNPTRFHVPIAVVTVLASILASIFGWKSSNRVYLVLSAVCAAGVLAFTIVYFFPKNDVIFRNQYIGLSGAEISLIASSWVTANWGRVVVMAIGFLAALRAGNFGLITTTEKGS